MGLIWGNIMDCLYNVKLLLLILLFIVVFFWLLCLEIKEIYIFFDIFFGIVRLMINIMLILWKVEDWFFLVIFGNMR